jgi:hypothetical protein
MPKTIIPSEFKTHLAEQLVESISEEDNTVYYSFIGDNVTQGTTLGDISQPSASNRDINVETFRKMIFGKKLDQDSMKIMVKRYEWVSGTVYDQYDDTDPDIYNKPYFVVVDEGSFKHVYKCLYNANGAPSTAQPLFQEVQYDATLFNVGDDYYETTDGYQWKYMYSIDSNTFTKFATQNYIPVTANTVIESNARNGTIEVVKIESVGKLYNNYIASAQFTIADIKVQGNPFYYKLPFSAGSAANFYGNTIMIITEGTGAGQYSRVTGSTLLEGIGVIAIIANTFTVTPDATSKYELTPEVSIVSDGTQTVNAVARAIINSAASNSISKIEMINVGENYSYATASVLQGGFAAANGGTASSSGEIVSPTPAEIRPIISPQGGHGSNTAVELGGSAVGIYTQFIKDENNTIPATNRFSQFGIMRDPKFANVEINITKRSDGSAGSDGGFIRGEEFYQFKAIQLVGNVTVEIGNTVIKSTNDDTDYDAYLRPGDYIYINNDTDVTISTDNFISEIVSVSNNTHIICKFAPNFSTTEGSLYISRIIGEGVVNNTLFGKIFGKRVTPLELNSFIIGKSSYACASAAGMNVNDRLATDTFEFQTFNQTYVITGSISGTFTANEKVYQGSSLETSYANASVFFANSTHLYLTDVFGEFRLSDQMIGVESEATVGIGFTKYSGELDSTSGTIIYLQNDIPVDRSQNQSEEVRVILEF